MDTLALKLILTPLLILAISLASRRWGEAVGGWLVGLPVTSGPVALFLALDQGVAFAEQAALGSLAATVAQACFCIAYFQMATLTPWPVTFTLATLAFAAAATILRIAAIPALPLYVVALVALSAGLYLCPRGTTRARAAILPLWDIPARMLVATSLVVGITTMATTLGPSLSGLLSTFPVFATVLTVFAHRSLGTTAARQVLRGLLLGLYCFSSFFVVLSLLMPHVSLLLAFATSTLAALLIHGAAFQVIRRQRRSTTLDTTQLGSN
jgi:uncharacterized membrane protein (GlpM family)